MLNHRRAYERMAAEYRGRFPGLDHPKKISVPIRNDQQGLIEAYVNTMFARLGDGTFGSKTVYVDEPAQALTAITALFDRNGNYGGSVAADKLTAERCGLMTAFTIEQAFDCTDYSKMIVGLVGVGRINVAVARMLNEILGIDKFILKYGSGRGRRIKDAPIPGDVFAVPHYRDLHLCDVVVSCTTNANRETMMQFSDVEGFHQRPSLFIAHDGGWLFGESFRERCIPYADHPAQIDADHDFPFDKFNPGVSAIMNLNHLHQLGCNSTPCIVYLSGMAMSDVIMAQEYLRGTRCEP
jgi:hypothetical protein